MTFSRKNKLGSLSRVLVVFICYATAVVDAWTWPFWKAPPTSASCTSPVPFADTADCTSYYQCFQVEFRRWELVHLTCPPGGIWDDQYKSCVQGTCGVTTTTPPTTPTTPTTKSPVTPAPTTKPPPPPITTPSRPSSPATMTTTTPTTKRPSTAPTPPPSGYLCPYEGFFPDPFNCRGYYRCVLINGRMYYYTFLCPNGASWNTSYNKCIVGNCQLKKNHAGVK